MNSNPHTLLNQQLALSAILVLISAAKLYMQELVATEKGISLYILR